MDLVKELLILLGRIVTIFPLMLLIALYMGRRAIGELPVFDFLILISLGTVVGADIADPKIEHIHTAVAIILIGILQKIVAHLTIKNRKFGGLITFKPVVVINDGLFIVENLKKIQYSIDEILLMLRENDVFDITDVKMAIIEANGKLTVLKKTQKSAVTVEDLNIIRKYTNFAYPLIVDGKLYPEILRNLNLNEDWLKQQLTTLGIATMDEIFFASIDPKTNLHISLKHQNHKNVPAIHH